jgi:hypothetical protein
MAFIIICTIAFIMVSMQVGILLRSTHGDVADSRQILVHMTDVAIGLATGLLIGNQITKEKP